MRIIIAENGVVWLGLSPGVDGTLGESVRLVGRLGWVLDLLDLAARYHTKPKAGEAHHDHV